MADLIDRAKSKEFPIRIDHYDETNGNKDFVLGIETVMEYVDNLPAVDAVEVVRCKDCKKSGMYAFLNDAPERLACLDVDESGFIEMAISVEPMDFCSRGERRADADLL